LNVCVADKRGFDARRNAVHAASRNSVQQTSVSTKEFELFPSGRANLLLLPSALLVSWREYKKN
jgi:hypothetical protein